MDGGLKGIWQAQRQPDAWAKRVAGQQAAIATAERIDAEEAQWLAGKLERYNRLEQKPNGLNRRHPSEGWGPIGPFNPPRRLPIGCQPSPA